MPIWLSSALINILLLILAAITVGWRYALRTIWGVLWLTIWLKVIPIATVPLLTDSFMAVVIGGLFTGCFLGICFLNNGSTGGTDIIALIVNKYRNVSPGRMIMWMDVVIILSSMLVPSYSAEGQLLPWTEKITTVVYGFILVVVNSTVIDMYLSGSRQSVQLFILSSKYSEIADGITHNLHRGVTVLDGKGWYTQHPTEVLLVVTRKSDLNLLLRYIKAIDSEAFLSVSSVNGVYGKGFDTIKLKKRTKS